MWSPPEFKFGRIFHITHAALRNKSMRSGELIGPANVRWKPPVEPRHGWSRSSGKIHSGKLPGAGGVGVRPPEYAHGAGKRTPIFPEKLGAGTQSEYPRRGPSTSHGLRVPKVRRDAVVTTLNSVCVGAQMVFVRFS